MASVSSSTTSSTRATLSLESIPGRYVGQRTADRVHRGHTTRGSQSAHVPHLIMSKPLALGIDARRRKGCAGEARPLGGGGERLARAGRMPPAAHVAAKHRPARPSHARARAHACGPAPTGIRRDGCLPQEAKALQCRLRGRGVMLGREGRARVAQARSPPVRHLAPVPPANARRRSMPRAHAPGKGARTTRLYGRSAQAAYLFSVSPATEPFRSSNLSVTFDAASESLSCLSMPDVMP